jgi:hypothetical protein
MYALPNLYKMLVRGIEDVEIFPLLESQMKREIGESGHRNSITSLGHRRARNGIEAGAGG